MSKGYQTTCSASRRRLFYDHVGARLREMRESRGLSLAQLAELTGGSASSIYNAEMGLTYSLHLAAKIAEALDCTCDELIPTEAT